MTDTVLTRVAALKTLPILALKQQWRDLFDGEPPPYNRRFLEHRLAYRIQELAYGGLKPETVKRLGALAEELDGGDPSRRRRHHQDKPMPGTRLIREWQGVDHCATVRDDDFEYQGRPYKSLSAVARAITGTRQSIHSCNLCGFFAVNEICEICADSSRSTELLCVTEQATDILPLEKTGAFRGRYHALGGKISPLDHVAPEDLRIKELMDRIDREKISEIIFALAADVEGEATTNYIVDLLKNKPVALTRIARGIPAGGGLESADELTLSAALSGRTKL